MSTESIYGGWDFQRKGLNDLDAKLQWLWSALAAQNVGTADFVPNFGLTQRKNEIIELWKLFVLQQPKVVLEIGTAQGGSFAGWCVLAPDDCTLISIDRCINDARPRPGEPVHPSIYNGHLLMAEQGGGVYHHRQRQQRVHAINGWSHDASTLSHLNNILGDRKIDFLFHDASHHHEDFHRDFETYWPLVTEGGILASHDICPCSDPKSNKAPEWDRIRNEEDYSALYEWRGSRNENSLGIGVIVK